ncbi:tripartite tricarboxylate transporter substrate-binding protein [Zwartia sp.]|uniref:Bug family tripartite tricarboxylate transporter substrate binding protein n=1 Tax=Zwartia sp. TaxID=2978004 RepID=UPI00272829EF|nr:tripartite tricarboxylate transporter substrate-binding protein [Zwartia sp.]MDO9023270.1 tripartite tricarboxylate transporter substrate-binding protein [Zwartia sp.]
MKIKNVLLAVVAGLCVQAPVLAQTYPSKPIRMLVAFPAGGSADIVARQVVEEVTKSTGMNFIIENRTGAGGNIAFEAITKADPDGYTLLFSTPGLAINPSLYSKVNYKANDVTAISLVGEAPLLLMVRPALPAKTVQELVAASKAAPDAIRFGSAGSGSSSHLAGEVFRNLSGMQYLHVPYRGGGPVFVDIVGNRVDMTFLPIAESLPYVVDNRLRAIGQTGTKRASIAPNIPTLAELGVKGYAVSTWYMLVGPPKLPKNVIDTLYKNFSAALNQPELRKKLDDRGVTILNEDPAKTTAFLKAETESWAKIIQSANIKVD